MDFTWEKVEIRFLCTARFFLEKKLSPKLLSLIAVCLILNSVFFRKTFNIIFGNFLGMLQSLKNLSQCSLLHNLVPKLWFPKGRIILLLDREQDTRSISFENCCFCSSSWCSNLVQFSPTRWRRYPCFFEFTLFWKFILFCEFKLSYKFTLFCEFKGCSLLCSLYFCSVKSLGHALKVILSLVNCKKGTCLTWWYQKLFTFKNYLQVSDCWQSQWFSHPWLNHFHSLALKDFFPTFVGAQLIPKDHLWRHWLHQNLHHRPRLVQWLGYHFGGYTTMVSTMRNRDTGIPKMLPTKTLLITKNFYELGYDPYWFLCRYRWSFTTIVLRLFWFDSERLWADAHSNRSLLPGQCLVANWISGRTILSCWSFTNKISKLLCFDWERHSTDALRNIRTFGQFIDSVANSTSVRPILIVST